MKIVSKHSFWSLHYSHIKEEGWIAIKRKIFRLMRRIGVTISLSFLAIPVVLIVRIIRPLIWVRFGAVRSDVIGNSVFNAEYYLSERALNLSNALDLFYFQSAIVSNEQWALMVRRRLRIHPFVRYLENANNLIPFGQNHCVIMMPPGRFGDIKGVLPITRPQTPFTEEEDRRGRKFLEEIGAKQGERFICLLVRDSYYKLKMQQHIKNNWSYHDYRDSDIDTFKNTALKLAEKGYWVLRMGKKVQKTFNVDHLRVLDYANSSYRSDFLDIWLMANCHFCITTGTGLDDVCNAFRRPLVQVNQIPIGFFRGWVPNYVNRYCILKYKNSGEFISLREQIKTGIIDAGLKEDFEKRNIEIIYNTPEEIMETVGEFEERLAGTWEETEEDIKLQNLYWKLLRTWPDFNQCIGYIRPEARVSALFLRKNQKWFLA